MRIARNMYLYPMNRSAHSAKRFCAYTQPKIYTYYSRERKYREHGARLDALVSSSLLEGSVVVFTWFSKT